MGKHGYRIRSIKAPVVALVQRDGQARCRHMPNVTGETLKKEIVDLVHRDSTIMTDDFSSYKGLKRLFTGGHETTKHSKREYVRGNTHTNTVESYFSLLKRGVIGTFHHVSRKHLDRYCDEFNFRWNYRRSTDAERTAFALRQTGGKRLTYRIPNGEIAKVNQSSVI